MVLNRRGPISRLIGGSIGLAKEYQADRNERKAVAERGAASVPSLSPAPSSSATNRDPPPPSYYSTDEKRNAEDNLSYTSSSESSSGDDDDDDDDEDDVEWARDLDEAQYQTHAHNDGPAPNMDKIIHSLPPPPPYTPLETPSSSSSTSTKNNIPAGILPLPVLIPQRRPSAQHRGFVRAYAPLLGDCAAGIPQDTFLAFLDGLNGSVAANPYFTVLDVAVEGLHIAETATSGFSPTAMLVTAALHAGVEGGRRAYLHGRQNGYLDEMNGKLFRPRGLYCMIVRYRPDSNNNNNNQNLLGVGEADVSGGGSSSSSREEDDRRMVERREGESRWGKYLRATSVTVGDVRGSAPLTFPELDRLGEEEKKSAISQFGGFLGDYYDRRARATFEAREEMAGRGGTGSLQVPKKEFASRFSDPEHPVNKGGLISLATGGKYHADRPSRRERRREGKRERRREREEGTRRGERRKAKEERKRERQSRPGLIGSVTSGITGSEPRQSDPNMSRKERRQNRGLKGLTKGDALYLMVVNMPSEQEMRNVLADVDRTVGPASSSSS